MQSSGAHLRAMESKAITLLICYYVNNNKGTVRYKMWIFYFVSNYLKEVHIGCW